MTYKEQNANRVHDYVIVGAGPGGLQMAYFLEQAKRDYVVLEANATPGSFFEVHPRHRQLISINKVHNYYEEAEFNLRHDWNSLLTHDPKLLFRNYSEELFPAADDYVKYMRDYCAHATQKVEFNTRVKRISRPSDGPFAVAAEDGRIFHCRCLLMATGTIGEKLPVDVPGIEHAAPYSTHSLDPDVYKNKRVAIIGRGNSAFEVANHLAGAAAVVHIMVGEKVKHAWQTHYVGDLRAVNNTILDMYQLKSLHATLGMRVRRITKNGDRSLRLLLEDDTPNWTHPATYDVEMDYDHVILCTGWKYFEPSLFVPEIRPDSDEQSKYPILSTSWESTTPDLFWIGAAMAAIDRKTASGFIHGFRYNIRSLFHLLEERYFQESLPRETFPLRSAEELTTLASHVVNRLSVASGLYQQNGFLADVLLVAKNRAEHIHEVPVAHVLERADFAAYDYVFTLTLEYGFHRYPDTSASNDFLHPSDPTDTSCSAFLHPVIRTYKAGECIEETQFSESLIVRYDCHFSPDAFGPEFNSKFRQQNENKFANTLNRALNILPAPLPETAFGAVFRPWDEERLAQHRRQLQEAEVQRKNAPCGQPE